MNIYFSCLAIVLSSSSASCLSLNTLNLADEIFLFQSVRLDGEVQDSSGEEFKRIEIVITKDFVSG